VSGSGKGKKRGYFDEVGEDLSVVDVLVEVEGKRGAQHGVEK
jgi:hypothetical protein